MQPLGELHIQLGYGINLYAGSVSSVDFGVAMIRSFHKSSLKIELNAVTNKTKGSFGDKQFFGTKVRELLPY